MQVFYRKWRPQTLAEIVGQEQVTQTLNNALASGRVSHAYLFYGPRGTGKTSTGRILAKAVNCTGRGKSKPCNRCEMCLAVTEGRALDVIEIDAASNRGIDEIRDLREKVNYAPNQARYKVYIVDEVHMLTKEAANALLKTLEEPPPYVIFILATTEVHKVPATILSRCQRFDFRRISQADVVSKLERICSSEGIQIEREGLQLIARSATGSLRDAENLLEQLMTYYGTEISLRQIQEVLGITGDQRAKELIKHIVNNDTPAGLATINSVNSDGLDLRQFNRELIEYLRELLLVKSGSAEAVDLTAEDIAELKELASKTSLAQIARAIKLFSQLELGFDNSLPLELALVDCTQPIEEVPPARPQPATPAPAAEPKPQMVKPSPPAEPKATPKVEPSPAPKPEAVPITPQLNNEIERLKQSWKQILAEAPAATKRTNAIAILRSADVKPVAIEGDTVVLDSKYEFYKEQIERPENLTVAEEIISNFLGRRCHVRCTHKPIDNHIIEELKKFGAQVTSVEEK
jgi:DNA polymerase-3 subunit gamma/tau